MKKIPREVMVSTRFTVEESEKIKKLAAARSIAVSKLVYELVVASLDAPAANNSKGE